MQYPNSKLRAYFNLTKKCYTIQQYKTGRGWRLFFHTDNFVVDGAYGRVSEATRQRIISTKKKYVHAYIYGTFHFKVNDIIKYPEPTQSVTYNPYKYSEFKVLCNNTKKLNNLNDYFHPTLYATIENKYPKIALKSA